MKQFSGKLSKDELAWMNLKKGTILWNYMNINCTPGSLKTFSDSNLVFLKWEKIQIRSLVGFELANFVLALWSKVSAGKVPVQYDQSENDNKCVQMHKTVWSRSISKL